jgi:hypothetical protein
VNNLITDEKKLSTYTGREQHKDNEIPFEDVGHDQYDNICHAQVLKINPEYTPLKIRASITTKSVKDNDAYPYEKENDVNRVSLCE